MKVIFLIYAGEHDKGTHVYYQLTDLKQNKGESVTALDLKKWVFDCKLFTSGIGSITPAAVKDEKTLSYKKKDYPSDFWKCESDITTWQALRTATNTIKAIQKEIDRNMLAEALEPIKRAYNASNWDGKRAIMAEVLRLLCK